MGKRTAILAYDSQGAAFYVVENTTLVNPVTEKKNSNSSKIKWKAIFALVLMALAVILKANWVWGIFCFLWIIPDLQSRSTYLFELVERRHNPILYWIIILTWIAFSIYLLFA